MINCCLEMTKKVHKRQKFKKMSDKNVIFYLFDEGDN